MASQEAISAAIYIMNQFKDSIADIVKNFHEALDDDGRIDGLEAGQLLAKCSNNGLNMYNLAKTIPKDVAGAVPRALLELEFVHRDNTKEPPPWLERKSGQ
jgi:hypothetical protein